ncbi:MULTISPECIES: 30S ribosomal protein S3 [Fervidicoccus]|jgi:small subunit ribosomal protein S3|uniref:Small ribosomal subunit protein uS3 n=2 Tax=Fervidicoccus fontis TaxID=683846 RepID=I0A0J7_FERFK|nr:30S ribosomal protein S3 [Fervidicoccus fontis]AFH42504.1 30S ribosomal protein S3P [Fervidicoccus fontis Kam940]PMB75729.1 MAG: 30S ribosomal protein S3 [Fervidicoccus fontis]PMB78115.1 MAG: 30S ribosomal protein S3 [Fervidicoccus fontis]HEW64181.1 30S ribosomal protein S3 [Fervidicoccus fontis]
MVNIKRYFIEKNMSVVKVDEYLAKQFYRAGYAGVDVYRTPLGTRVVIRAERPAFIIGRRGQTIKTLSNVFENYFGLENPQITVMPVENPDLNARVVAFRLAVSLERGFHFRKLAFAALRRIMAAGAAGAEIIISGKITSERARYEKFRAGKIYKTGEQATYIVDKAVAHALLKPGIYGVKVIIVKPERTKDSIIIKSPEEIGINKESTAKEKEQKEEMGEQISTQAQESSSQQVLQPQEESTEEEGEGETQ